MHRRTLLQAAALGLATPAIAQPIKTLRFVPYVDLAILDPMINTASQTRTHGYLVYDTLYAQNAAYQSRPEMVEGHVIEDEARRWTLTLRENLRFHDDTPVLARDVVASLKRWGAADPAGRAMFAQVADIAAPTDRTVTLRFHRPYHLLPDVLGKIAPSMACIMPERLAATPPTKAVTEIIGSGPFRFVANERVPGSRVVYERFAGYVPRPGAEPPGQTSGPKRVNLDRVEWITMPEAGTAAAALRNNEVDWWEVPPPDLLPMLRRDRNLTIQVYDKTGVMPVLRLNCLQPPFDNPTIRHAVLQAASQRDFMQAFSNDPAMWKDRVGLFTPGTPMATDAGLEPSAEPDIAVARKAITAAGYAGQRVVVMQPTDHPVNNTMAQVGADLMKQLGLNVDLQAMDAGTMFQRRANRESVDKGGWSVFPSMVGGADTLTPAVSFLTRGNGADAWYGWPTIPKLEAARAAWFDAPDLPAQRALCADMQRAVLEAAPHIHLGQILQPTAIRTGITGVLDGIPKFWNVQKA